MPKTANQSPLELTGRQKKVLSLIADGATRKAIVEQLYVCSSVVYSETTELKAKLGAVNLPNLVSKAYQKGLLTVKEGGVK